MIAHFSESELTGPEQRLGRTKQPRDRAETPTA